MSQLGDFKWFFLQHFTSIEDMFDMKLMMFNNLYLLKPENAIMVSHRPPAYKSSSPCEVSVLVDVFCQLFSTHIHLFSQRKPIK